MVWCVVRVWRARGRHARALSRACSRAVTIHTCARVPSHRLRQHHKPRAHPNPRPHRATTPQHVHTHTHAHTAPGPLHAIGRTGGWKERRTRWCGVMECGVVWCGAVGKDVRTSSCVFFCRDTDTDTQPTPPTHAPLRPFVRHGAANNVKGTLALWSPPITQVDACP